MLKQGTPVMFIVGNGTPVTHPLGTPAIFTFQEFAGPCAEVIDEDGKLVYFSAFIVMQALSESEIVAFKEAREKNRAEAEREARRKQSGIVTANIVPPKSLKH